MFGEAVGLAYLKSFDRIFDLLRSHPEAGALRGDLHPPIRSISHRSHRIFYTFEDDVIRIVRVLHHAMDERRWLPG